MGKSPRGAPGRASAHAKSRRGLGYFPGKQSWLEPTFYAALSLHGEPESDRAWALLASWQQTDGGWRPSQTVQVDNWGTALCVSLAAVRGDFGEHFHRGVIWLLDSAGNESDLLHRAAERVGLFKPERDLSLRGWPWKPDTTSWLEPTAHTVVALKKAAPKFSNSGRAKRVSLGEAQILDVRCSDGGWNYGSRIALGVELPSYPETTAVALLALQGRPNLGASIDAASRMARQTASPLARAWLAIALRLHGVDSAGAEPSPTASSTTNDAPPPPDLMITAIEALAAREGNYKLLATGGAA